MPPSRPAEGGSKEFAKEKEGQQKRAEQRDVATLDVSSIFNLRFQNSTLPEGKCVYIQSGDPGDFDGEQVNASLAGCPGGPATTLLDCELNT